MTTEAEVFPQFPYDRKFTRAELDEIADEAMKLADAMRDGQAPNGATLFIDEAMLQLWCVHGALAGVRVHPDLAYIVAVKQPDRTGQFADSVEWVLRDEAPDEDAEEEAAAEAERIATALTQRLPEKVRRLVAQQMSDAFNEANKEDRRG
ncbi:phage gene 29 protein family protein [Mycobacteroides abscessus]|uniref:phage gene 29 protein family protein n=1 Tax=Mycobacteroides abscessus TaxID=36809 RepID=UPI0005DD35A8|nr:hypothetical protein [Mycobacteroides abscessus]CPR79148.1 Uncharacterised protein [Mycobacteroides abscessus]CPR88314.1 Uncharacterised protein [Mycobacteroides abscessus]CPS43259.1 Uncharacterised protein [Mycobacteroides abscessus]CPV03048.1 Uncharacterised protein [Mycobacteroides abscessus]